MSFRVACTVLCILPLFSELVSVENSTTTADLECPYAEEWSAWSLCSLPCGGGEQRRDRFLDIGRFALIDDDSRQRLRCDATIEQLRPCNVRNCHEQECVLSLWTRWSACHCTSHTMSRTRQVLVRQPHADCLNATEQTKECHARCTVNCMLSEWSSWGECSATCGRSARTRQRQVESHPTSGGRECGALVDVAACPTHRCADQQSACFNLSDGNYADAEDACSGLFISCVNGDAVLMSCGKAHLVFDDVAQRCNHVQLVRRCSPPRNGGDTLSSPFQQASLLAMLVILLLFFVFVVRIMLWDAPCCTD